MVKVGTPRRQMTHHTAQSYSPIGAGITNYLGLTLVGGPGFESVVSVIMDRQTIREIYTRSVLAPGVGQTFTYDLFLNGVVVPGITIVIAGAAVTGVLTGLAVPVARGDLASMQIVTSAGAAVTYHGFSLFGDQLPERGV